MSKPNTLTPGDYDTLQMIASPVAAHASPPKVKVDPLIELGFVEVVRWQTSPDTMLLTDAGKVALRERPKSGGIQHPSPILE